MPVTLHVAADDGAVEDIQRGEQRRRAVALVVVGHGAEAAFLQRQARLGAVERLDLAFLVDAKHDGMGGWIDIEPTTSCSLAAKSGSVESLKLPHPVRLQPVGAPDALHRTDADADFLRHHRRRPVGRLGRRIGQRAGDHALSHGCAQRRNARRPHLVAQQAIDALLGEPFLPAPDAGLRLAGPAHDRVGAEPAGAQHHDRRTPNVLLRGVAVPDQRLQAAAIGPCHRQGYSVAHALDSHALVPVGIPIGIQMSDFIH